MNDKFLSPYKPEETEGRIYQQWLDSGFFNPDTCIDKGVTKAHAETFSIVLPPPNVTGVLHMGHAAMIAIEDIIVRYQRMNGKRTLWIPGTDHAAIATQSKVEKILEKEGVSKRDMGRDAFMKRVEQFAEESHDTIVDQIKKMGASIDWSREAFTLDEERSLAVRTAFKRMYDDKLIYRSARIVNWDPKGQTTISDDEIVHVERKATLYTFKYWKDFPIPISTTRPETKVGDVAVAVNPRDTRYAEFVGQTFPGEFCGVHLDIKIVADESVEKDFGTGALGVTPAHSQIDWEIAQRHGLPRDKQVINEYAKMFLPGNTLHDKKVGEARASIVEMLRADGLIENEVEVSQNVATAERTGGIIEPLPKLQWWIDVEKEFAMKGDGIPGIQKGQMTSLKEVMRQSVTRKAITILPERFEKTYFQWIDNLRPWCISRQIWYGHRIPSYLDASDPENYSVLINYRGGVVGEKRVQNFLNTYARQQQNDIYDDETRQGEAPELMFGNVGGVYAITCRLAHELVKNNILNWDDLKYYESVDIHGIAEPIVNSDTPISESFFQDTDTLDTWFSSGLWTFSTLGWPNTDAKDLIDYHPTNLLETGYDILFFWVARMVLMSGYHLGTIPFRTVYLHGLVRDEKGKKMSKSLGNAIDPLDMIEKYGADATRLSVIIGAGPGSDVSLSEDKIKGYKKYSNKIWNITRFILSSTEGADILRKPKLTNAHEVLIKQFNELVVYVTKHIEEYKLHLAAEKLYHYTWNEVADVIIESQKGALLGPDGEEKTSAQWTLLYILENLLKLHHPFMPFITEEIWAELPNRERQLIVTKWPTT